jgi:hypothetical protein
MAGISLMLCVSATGHKNEALFIYEVYSANTTVNCESASSVCGAFRSTTCHKELWKCSKKQWLTIEPSHLPQSHHVAYCAEMCTVCREPSSCTNVFYVTFK